MRVVLDNSAATFSTAVVACTVTLEPLAQLAVRAAYDARRPPRGSCMRRGDIFVKNG